MRVQPNRSPNRARFIYKVLAKIFKSRCGKYLYRIRQRQWERRKTLPYVSMTPQVSIPTLPQILIFAMDYLRSDPNGLKSVAIANYYPNLAHNMAVTD